MGIDTITPPLLFRFLAGRLKTAKPIVRWHSTRFNGQPNFYPAHVALQAYMQYIRAYNPDSQGLRRQAAAPGEVELYIRIRYKP